jgi:hypothetical protein
LLFSWKHLMPWDHPYDKLRNYFGEKVCLYYKFVGHFMLFLLVPAVVGIIEEIAVAATSTVTNPSIPFYSLFIVMWGVLMLEFWKRKEKFTALEWGMLDFEATEAIRAEFKDFEKISLTGEETLYFSPEKKRNLLALSFFIIILLCCAVIGTTACIYVIRYQLASANADGALAASFVPSIMNTLQIQIYGLIFAQLSDYLTDIENHMTDTQYEDSMITKNFMFSFINSYASFFFIAYFASSVNKPTYPNEAPNSNIGLLVYVLESLHLLNSHLLSLLSSTDNYIITISSLLAICTPGMCGYPDCMDALAINLAIVLGTGILVNNTVGILLPYYTFKHKQKEELKRSETGKILTFGLFV